MGIGPGRFQFGPDNARVLLRTGRTGIGSRAGHDLTIEVTDWSAEVDIPENGPAEATVRAHLALGSLAVREGTGGATPLTDQVRREIEGNARRTLGVDEHPSGVFESTRIATGSNGGKISGNLTLNGTARPIDVRVETVEPDRYRGTAVVTQSAYGIKPYTAFFGALKVRDDVEVEIDIDWSRAR
jgi:polyisoprenoid-binding protein YceI